jgi:hypothetical protein
MEISASNANRSPAGAEALLDSLIDYAGLFPPARLPLDGALDEYVTRLAEPGVSRYLGYFVIPVGLLPRAAAWFRQHSDRVPANARFSVLADPADDYGQIASAMHEFELSWPGARVETLELKVEASAADGYAGISRTLDRLEAAFRGDSSPRSVFVEIDWRSDPSAAMALLETRERAGAKLRSGGLTPDLVPPPAAVARFLQTAARFRLPLKFTAGLHVPVPNDDPAVGARMHGFLNVMAAAMAAYRGRVSTEELVKTLEQLGYADFSLDEDGFRAGALRFSVSEIRLLRKHVRGFGSCSFLEPLEHLAEHGILASAPRKRESLAQS